MNRPATALILLLWAGTGAQVWAAPADAVVVFHGNSEVNREAYNFIRKSFNENGIQIALTAALDPFAVKPGQYRSVVVLNTGIRSGLDPVLEKFLSEFPDKKTVFLVNLYQGANDLKVIPFKKTVSPPGVDGVTAASAWKGLFGGYQGPGDPKKMHAEWVRDLAAFLGRP